jgi:hypothetical protein
MNQQKSWPYILLSLLMLILVIFNPTGQSDVGDSASGNRASEGLLFGEVYLSDSKKSGYVVLGIGSCTDKELVIPSSYKKKPVLAIESEAFRNGTIESVVIPSSVEWIGTSAFENCEYLRRVELSEGLLEIQGNAFYECDQLEAVTVPETVREIGYGAFGHCASMTRITIGKEVKSIGANAFAYCYSLVTADLPDSVSSLGEGAFFCCIRLKSASVPKNIEVIPARLFAGCETLQDVEIRGAVRIIDVDAFLDCKQLGSVTLPESLELICGGAFSGCISLGTLYYKGTVSMWNNQVYTERDWRILNLHTISCSDAAIPLR